MPKILLDQTDVVNDLNTEATDKPLSAAQGAALKRMMENGGGGGSALPEVSATDNGKFLRVVDGAWAAVAIATYLGEYEVVT